MRIPKNKETENMLCSHCLHKVSRHDLTTFYGSKKVNAKCKTCDCNNPLIIA